MPSLTLFLVTATILGCVIKAEGDASIEGFAQALRAGLPPSSLQAVDLAEAHRQHITTWFYECGFAQHVKLAELYVSEQRYIAEYDKVEPCFCQYVHDARSINKAGRPAWNRW